MTIKEAYEKIKNSDELKKKGIEAVKTGKVEEFLKENNLDITIDQIKDFLKQAKNGELSKEELDMAAGGGCGSDACDWSDWLYSFASFGFGCVVSGTINLVNNETNQHAYDC